MSRRQKMALLRIAAAALLFVISIFIPTEGWIKLLVCLVPFLVAGYDIVMEAIGNIFRGNVFDEKFLMSLASLGAFAIGEYHEAVFVMLFFQVGELFESIAVGKSRRSVAQLMDIRPDHANVLREGKLCRVDPEDVAVGETITVMPGERVPLDGVLIEGCSSLDTAALTGESLPRDVREGDSVISGCVNISGVLQLKVTKACSESTVSRILELVEESAANKSRSETFITRFARWYTPAVVICALVLAVLPSLITGEWGEWVHRALVFLVVSCPCALVISVPLSYFGGIGKASKRGILVKGSNYLDTLASCSRFVFDKTGTLTQGCFSVEAVEAVDGDTDKLIRHAALAEAFSSHPIALGIKAACGEDMDISVAKDVQEHSGFGVSATIGGTRVMVGKAELLEENAVTVPAKEHSALAVHVSADCEYLGCIILSDSPKPDSAEAIRKLKALGVKQTVMLTGDGEESANTVGSALGIDRVCARLLPADKVKILEELLAEGGGALAYVGDGINDAPSLSRADLGIAMGALGSDAAIEAADVVLMDDYLSRLPEAVSIAVRTRRIVAQNIVFALAVKFLVLGLGALGYAGMWAAVMADVGVCLVAILNAMRSLK